MTAEVGLGIDHLTDVQLIGSGGFSVVYAATHVLFDRRVAVKVLTNVKGESDKRRFERECRAMGRLSGAPNVVTVFDAAYTSRGEPYLIMELVEGGTLADRLATSGRLGWQEAVDLTIPICTALSLAHREGILHRDVKPENILLDEGGPKLTDFGIAHLRDSTGNSSTHVSASWLHTPPETFDNKRDERSDLYSLASTLHTLIVGHPPFWRESDESLHPLMNRLLNEPVPEMPSGLAPPGLRSLLLRAMAKDSAERPQTATELAAALAEIRGVAPPTPGETAPGAMTPGAAVLALDSRPSRHSGGLLTSSSTRQSVPSTTLVPATSPGAGSPPPVTTLGQPGAFGPAPSPPNATGHQFLAIGGTRRSPLTIDAASPTGSSGPAGQRPITGVRPVVSDHPSVLQSRAPRRFGLAAVLLLIALIGALGAFSWWSNRNDAAASGEGVATSDGGDDTSGATQPEPTEAERTGREGAAGVGTAADATTEPVLTVPDVVGLAEPDAVSRLEALGITASVESRVTSESVEAGRVVSQDPATGAEATLVRLTVSTGPPPVELPTVPDVTGLAETEAVQQLEDRAISVTVGSREPSGTVPAGHVIDQTPTAGAQAGDATLTISTGGTVTIDLVTFSPPSPRVFTVGERLNVSIDYTSIYDGNVRIWARPTSGDYGASGSSEIQPGSASHLQWFALNSPGTVDRIRVFAVDVETDELISERFFDVSYTWEEEPGPPATPTQLSPASGTVFDHFPRATTLTWSGVLGAVSYGIETQFFSGSTWSSGVSAGDIAGTSHTFDFVGAQPGRWRVWAVGSDGQISAKSSWWTFEYTI